MISFKMSANPLQIRPAAGTRYIDPATVEHVRPPWSGDVVTVVVVVGEVVPVDVTVVVVVGVVVGVEVPVDVAVLEGVDVFVLVWVVVCVAVCVVVGVVRPQPNRVESRCALIASFSRPATVEHVLPLWASTNPSNEHEMLAPIPVDEPGIDANMVLMLVIKLSHLSSTCSAAALHTNRMVDAAADGHASYISASSNACFSHSSATPSAWDTPSAIHETFP